jgi:hypothetical protein
MTLRLRVLLAVALAAFAAIHVAAAYKLDAGIVRQTVDLHRD